MSSNPFSAEELEKISCRLSQYKVDGDKNGSEWCNYLFGFNNWSSEIRELRLSFTHEDNASNGKVSYSSGASAICRIILRDGSHRDAVGTGESFHSETKMKSIEVAQRAAVEAGLSGCLDQFQLGNSHAQHPSLSSAYRPSNKTVQSPPLATSTAGQKRSLPESQHYVKSPPHKVGYSSYLPKQQQGFQNTSSAQASSRQHSNSPTIDDIDSIMLQYDQVGGESKTCGNSSSLLALSSNVASKPHSYSDASHHKVVGSSHQTHPNLQGQKYPSRPNLTDPFTRTNPSSNGSEYRVNV